MSWFRMFTASATSRVAPRSTRQRFVLCGLVVAVLVLLWGTTGAGKQFRKPRPIVDDHAIVGRGMGDALSGQSDQAACAETAAETISAVTTNERRE